MQLVRLALALSLALVAVPAAAQAQTANPLVGEWHLDEDFPRTNEIEAPRYTPDSSGGGRDFDYCNGCAGIDTTGGRFGGHLSVFSSDNPLTTGPGADLQRVTLIAWVRTNVAPPGSSRVIAGRGTDSVACEEMPYSLQQDGGDSPPGARFSIRRPDGSAVSAPVSDPIDDNQWHMLAGTFDGTTVRLYVDGQQVGTGTPAGTSAIGYGAGGGNFGIDGYTGSGCANEDFGGGIDEVREYNRVLSATEIGRLATPGATTPPNLVPDGGGGGSPTPNPPPSPPRPFFVSDTLTPDPFDPVTFNATLTRTAVPLQSFDWDITGDGKKDVSCDPQTPLLTTNTLKPSVKSIGLTVVDGLGSSATFRRPINVSASTTTPALRSAVRSLGLRASLFSGTKVVGGMCSPANPGAVRNVDTTANGGPSAGCLDQIVYGSFKAVGCFRLVSDPADLPPGERAQVDTDLRKQLFSPKIEDVLDKAVPPGGLLRGGGSLPTRPFRSRAVASASFAQAGLVLRRAVADSTYVAEGKARVNGLDVEPITVGGVKRKVMFVGGGQLATAKAKLVSSGAEVVGNSPFGRIPMKRGELLQAFGIKDTSNPFGSLNIPKQLKLVPSLGVKGSVSAKMDQGKLNVRANVALPKLLNGVTVNTKLQASTEKGLELDYFKFTVSKVPLGPVDLRNVRFEWIGPQKLLTAALEAKLLFGIGAGGTIRFEQGAFRSLKVFAEKFPGIKLAPGVFLTRVDAAYDDRGPVIEGGGVITVGPNPGGGCPKVGVVGTVKLDFNWPITLSGTGNSQLLCFSIASIGASLNEYGYGTFFGRFNPNLSPLPLSLDANAKGQIQAPVFGRELKFQLDMDLRACVDFGRYAGVRLAGCLGGEFVASDTAMAFCANFNDWIKAGVRVFYPPPATVLNPVTFAGAIISRSKILAPGCNVGDYRSLPKLASASQAGDQAFTIPAGRKDTVVAFRGRGGAPDMVLRGPGGRTIDVPSKDMVRNNTHVAFRLDYDDTAYVIIRRPEAGRWTASLKPGSPALVKIEAATELPPIKLKASVKKSGAKRVLRYRINRRKGQSIRFTELAGPKAGKFLAETKRASGRIRFTPAESRTSTHSIKAVVIQDGAPRDSFTVARFRAALPKIGRPRKLKARRSKSRLVITWRKAKNAQAYRAFVTLSDGRKLFFTPRRRRIVVRGVAKTTRATVVIQGRRASRLGRRSTLRVKAAKAKKKRSKARRKR